MIATVNAEPTIKLVQNISIIPNIFSFNLSFGVQIANKRLLDINVVMMCS